MSRCPCQLLGERLQQPAHQLHTQVGQRARELRRLAQRYLTVLHRRPRRDPRRDALIERMRQDLRVIQNTGRRYLPGEQMDSQPLTDQAIKETLSVRRKKQNGSTVR